MPDYSDREQCSLFGYIAILNVDERNELDAYLSGLTEFKEWDELGFLMGLQRAALKGFAKSMGSPEVMEEFVKPLLPRFRRYKELEGILKEKVKNWCKAMVDEAPDAGTMGFLAPKDGGVRVAERRPEGSPAFQGQVAKPITPPCVAARRSDLRSRHRWPTPLRLFIIILSSARRTVTLGLNPISNSAFGSICAGSLAKMP
jgi:hypothetical protein